MKKIFTILGVVSFAAFATAQVNLVPNPGFESWADGKPTDWFIPAGVTMVQSTTAHSGTYSAGLPSPATSNRTMSPTTDIPVTAGKTYVFTGWYLDNTPTARFRYWGQFRTAPGTAGTDTGANNLQGADYSVDSPEWKFFTAEAQPNATATVLRAGLRVYPENNSGDGVILFDDIMVYDKASMAVTDVSAFDKSVKMNTVVGNELRLILPGKATVNIYSADGRLVSSNRVDNGQAINTSSMAKGNYIVTVDNGSAKVSRKVIKN